MSRQPTARINTAMRDAFLKADITGAPSKLLVSVAKAATGGIGVIKRFQMWNKTYSG